MVIENPVAAVNAAVGANGNSNAAHPSGIPQDQIDNIMSGIANTGDVKMNNHRKKLRQRFDIIKKLGQGTYGKVQLGINKETGQEVAIKTIKKCKIEAEADLVRIRREVQIMSSVQHPNIIHIYEVFENREKMVLVMEFAAGGELYDYLSERKVLTEEEARRIFRQVSTAVYYCHKHKICHRDLKLENILLDEHGNAKIADFGLSNVFDDQRLLATFCGSPLYASPEIVEGTPYQGPEVDCWSLGVLLYTLVYGSMPFDGSNFKRLVKQISQGDYYEPKKPSRASTLIRDMLTVCPRKRASIEQICAHWWVNENDKVSCLELAESLANQTPVRLDVLLSLTPAAITADQLVVTSADGGVAGKGGNAAMPRSHSVGSIRDMTVNTTTEAERRILDMVAAGGEAALMPSPTRTITPAQSPVQTKRKLETTISMENAAALKKKEKAGSSSLVIHESTTPLTEDEPMEMENAVVEEPPSTPAAVQHASSATFSQKDMELVGDLCEELIKDEEMTAQPTTDALIAAPAPAAAAAAAAVAASGSVNVQRQKIVGKLDAVQESPEEKDATKVIKKFVNKHKTADLINAVGQITTPTEKSNETKKKESTSKSIATQPPASAPFVRKCSLQDETALNKFNGDRRKSRILETAEKFQQMNASQAGAAAAGSANNAAPAAANEKPKKIVIPGVSVGSFKKEFERKASNATVPAQGPTLGEQRALEQAAAAAAEAAERESTPTTADMAANVPETADSTPLEGSDSKNSVSSISLEEARRSMENSIALLRQAQSETSEDVDQLCAKTENIGVSELPVHERERKLKNARAIIGNAIQPVIRRPQAQPQLPLPQQPPLLSSSNQYFGISGGSRGGSGGGISKINTGGNLQRRASIANPTMQIGGIGYGYDSGNSTGSSSGSSGRGDYSVVEPSYAIANVAGNIENGFRGGSSGFFGNGSIYSQPLITTNAYQNSNSNFNSNSNSNAALAAARQNIMRHFATGSFGGFSIFPQNPQQQQQQQQTFLRQQQQQKNSSVASKAKLFNNQSTQQQQQPQQKPDNFQKRQQQQQHIAQFSASLANASDTALAAGAATSTAAEFSAANNVVNLNSVPKPFYNARTATPPTSSNWLLKSSPDGTVDANNGVKTSTASITLKSATLPRRKTAKSEIQLDIKPRITEQQPTMRFTTEMQHPVPDLRSAPAREGPPPFSPVKTTLNTRATSLEPKEHIIHIQRPPQVAYSRTTSNTTNRSGSLSRQSTNDSESDTTTTNMSQGTITTSSQPIKKSPREFIIPIAVEGGGFITPREGSIEPSESSQTTSSRSTFNRFNQRPARRIGSLLSEAGVDDSQFQKLRTSSTNREGDDDGRFTIHKLRSSRPVKKISQDNDSNSSGEEDDDDGFEILTAENLFSTLLQRVRALTNRLNVNNDLTSGFPNSSRLLTSMRHGRGPFWNQEPFTRSQMSYTYSETIEKKHVRLNSAGNSINSGSTGIGSPWRHSMSRDLGNDMESMFSRTGATLPRGSSNRSNSKKSRQNSTVESEAVTKACLNDVKDIVCKTEEPMDLADLDLSRLRLSKKELETLSSIAPGLPKCFQEQLLAKLPPTQARKLSRTLSMQSNTQTPAVKVYKRSQSGGRGVLTEVKSNISERCDTLQEESESSPIPALKNKTKTLGTTKEPTTNEPTNSQESYGRSVSRTRNDLESSIPTPLSAIDTASNITRKTRSNSVCRDDYSKSHFTPYTSDINDKYKYYSPYLSKSTRDTTTNNSSSTESGSTSPYKRYSSISPRESTIGAVAGRPPSGCLSPTPAASGEVGNTSSLRRRPTQRRISRFLRPDFYEEQSNIGEETAYQREKKQRERETQSVLREIREKSRDSSRERLPASNDNNGKTMPLRKHSITGTDAELLTPKCNYRHVRNKSMELYNEPKTELLSPTRDLSSRGHRRSLSRPRNMSEEQDTHALADKILQELQLLSAIRTEQEKQRLSTTPHELSQERKNANSTAQNETVAGQKTVALKKVKKVKPKEKEKTTDATGNTIDDSNKVTTITVVKKVKKVVKKSDNMPKLSCDVVSTEQPLVVEDAVEQTRKESKLKRPKSFPTKEIALKTDVPTKIVSKLVNTIPEGTCTDATCPLNSGNFNDTTARSESRLIRPKSYPTSKLTPPKDLKKTTPQTGAAMPSIADTAGVPDVCNITPQSTSEEKSQSATPTGGKSSLDTSSSSDSKRTIKKNIKVTKKSKLMQPTALTPITPTTPTTATITPIAEAKEWKEKSPEKKLGKGLLYAIGQRFEKFRDSAMNKEKKLQATSASVNSVTVKTPTVETVPEKKSLLLKKKKPIDCNNITPTTSTTTTKKTEKTAKTTLVDETKISKSNSKEVEKPMKTEKRSRLDAMIRSLRERSVPRAQHVNTESNYIKRAVSVEEMPGTFNKNAVNRVLGLFKRFEKEGSTERRVRSTRSTSTIERHLCETPTTKSPIYQNVVEARESAKVIDTAHGTCDCEATCRAMSDTAELLTCPDCIAQSRPLSLVLKRREEAKAKTNCKLSLTVPTTPTATIEHTQTGNRDKRKGLMLDLIKLDNAGASMSSAKPRNSKVAYVNGNTVIGNGLYSNLPPYNSTMVNSSSNHSSSQHSMENTTNNNSCTTNNNNNNNSSSMHTSQTSGYRTSSTHEINRNNILAPSTENMANYSSDCSRSYQDDCASTSTFLSPTEEPELYFDNWSVCSEDNYMLHASPSPTVSRLSRTSQLSSPTRANGGDSSDPNESIIDRIKRRSFYCRFNEKKPKRTSSIVGPAAVRDYYREQKAAMKSTRSSNKLDVPSSSGREHSKSPDITQEFLRPLKLSPVGTELKPPVYKSPYRDYTGATLTSSLIKPRKSLGDIRTTTTPSYLASKHRYGANSTTDHQHDYLSVPSTTTSSSRYKSSTSTSPYDTSNISGSGTTATGGSSSNYYSTYNPKRRSSYALNGILPSGTGTASTNIDSYATLGRRSIRPYDQRTMSLLDPTATTASSVGYRHEARTPIRDYTTPTISRSNSRYQNSSTSRSPTNI